MNRRYVYIAGPYGDKDPYCVIDERINIARMAARELAILAIPYYSSHLNCAHFEVIAPQAPEEFWKAMGMGFVDGAAALLMLPNWKASKGSVAEWKRALELSIPVYERDGIDKLAHWWHDTVHRPLDPVMLR